MTVKFNIGTFSKTSSIFNNGMRPLFYSEKKGKWCRCGENISYFQSRRKRLQKKRAYILTFTHRFEHSKDKCFFAYSYPYTYSDLQDYLKSLQLDKSKSCTFRRSLLSRTLAGNRCDLLTITEQTSSLKALQQRKGIVISARVHPGENVASWICKGVIDFLTSDCKKAIALRQAFVFKVIPMLNPDGVVNGNYR
jgi:murein tripeptide amidase MpaA